MCFLSRTKRTCENPTAGALLLAKAGQQRLNDRSNEKDKYKVRGNAAGRIIFSNLGHASSRRFEFWK
jgi:hypothetical protein